MTNYIFIIYFADNVNIIRNLLRSEYKKIQM